MPAEKLIRSMFGLDKAKTPGFLGGATGAALAMNTMQSLSRFAGKGPGPKGNKPMKTAKDENEDGSNGIYDRSADSGHGIAALYDENNNEDGTDNENERNTNSQVSEGPSATDANLNSKDGENPVARMERESLEKKLADGQITKEDLTEEQKQLLGINGSNKEQQGTNRMLEESKSVEEARKKQAIMAKGKRTIRQRAWNGVKGFGTGVRNSAKLKNITRAVGKVGKNGLRLTGATIGAGFGIAAGAATGDFNNVVKNAGLGLSAGNSIGAGIGNNIESGINNSLENYKKAKEADEKERYGKDYNQYKNYKADQKFFKDTDARKEYNQAFSDEFSGLSAKEKKEKLDKIMNNAIKYREEGVTDNKLIIKAMKLDKEHKDSKDSIAAAVMANKAKDINSMENYEKDLSKVIKPEKASEITAKAKKISGFSI